MRMLTSGQHFVDLSARFSIKAVSGKLMWTINTFSNLTLDSHKDKLFEMVPRDHVMSAASQVLQDDTLTIIMTGAYVIHTQHTIVTLSAGIVPPNDTGAYPSVKLTYTWHVCNLSLPAQVNSLVSKSFPTASGVAQFYLLITPGTEYPGYVSVYSYLFSLPHYSISSLRVNHTFALMSSNSSSASQLIVTDEVGHPAVFDRNSVNWGYPTYFTNDAVKRTMHKQCLIFRYRSTYFTCKRQCDAIAT